MPSSTLSSLSSPLLFLSSLLLLLVLSPSFSQSATLTFVAQSTSAPFSRRSHVNVEAHAQSTTWVKANGASVTASNTLILQGNDNAQENDVWISSDQGATWDLISGVSQVNGGRYPAPNGYDMMSYRPAATAVGFTTDTQGRIFRIGGQTSDPLTAGTCALNVWMSTDGKTWEDQQSRTGANFPIGRKFASAISDSADRLYLLGGQTCNWAQLYDLWVSTDQGRAWVQQTANLPVSGPIAGVLLNVPVNPRANLPITEALIYTTGWDGNSDYNDVFISTNRGTSWQTVNRGAAFTNRDDANGEVTRDGIIVVMGGKRETFNGGVVRTEVLNDVWVSGDGGYSWSLCALDAEWDDRRYQASALDAAGYLYVVGGLGPGDNTNANRKNDVWRSSISFNNLAQVEAQCSLTRPACGYGITCLPNDPTTVVLARGVTCAAAIACGGAAGETSVDFRAQNPRSLWSPRAAPFVGRLQQPTTFINTAGVSIVAPANSFVLHGTSNYQENDVWISTNRMVTWALVSGVSLNGFNFGGRARTPADLSSFNPATYGGAYAIDANNRLYRVSGESSSNVCSNDVWTSVGGITWTRYPQTNTFAGRMWAQLVVSPADQSVTLFGGRTCTGGSLFDVWRSNNQGNTWTRVSDNTFSAAGPRNGMAGIYRSPVLNREIISYAAGWDGNTDYNDVQASSDGGATWATVTNAANWQRRDDVAGLVTPDGVLILVGGKTNTATGEVFHNDIWVSMDGGYSWGRCAENLAFTDRRYEAITLDEAGYLYVVAGETNERNPREYLNDAWRSTISFSNFAAVAQSCGVTVPRCGPGLNCWPTGPGTVRLPGNAGVTCPLCASSATIPPLDFVRQCANAPWSPRSHGNIELYKKTIAYVPVGQTAQVTVSNALVLQGNTNGVENDVWLSTDHGATWALIAGISVYGRSGLTRATSPQDTRSFSPATRYAAFALDAKASILYRVQGYSDASGSCYAGVLSSVDGKTWGVINNGVNGITPTREYAAAITDSNGYVYVQGGRQCFSTNGLEDVWRSTDKGKTWQKRNTNNVPFGMRLVHLLLNFQASNKVGGANVLMVLGGWTGGSDRNDVWASSDGGVQWQLITLGAGWDSRDDMNGEITAAGLLIVSGGKTERPGVPFEYHNDVWVSADGGYSWGQCVKDASFSDRRYQMTVLDEAGYLIVAAGSDMNDRQVNDVWRSSFSFNNLAEVQRACGISIPSCGVGLACLPNSPGFRRLPGNRGVSCNACTNTNYAASFDFIRLTGTASWSARSHGHVELMKKPIRWTNVFGDAISAPANSLVLMGNNNYQENDVWISMDHGLVWELISGRSLRGRNGVVNARPTATTSFTPDAFAPAFAQDSQGAIYRIQGQPTETATVCTNDVWYSTTGIVWTNQYTAPLQGRGRITPPRRYAAAVGDNTGKVFVSGGTACVQNVGLNDVWMSINKGVDWTLQTARAPWSGRLVHTMQFMYSRYAAKGMLLVFTGWSGTTDSNDVWASSDEGRNWRQLTAAAPWSSRDDANAEITAAGLVILTSGKTDVPNEIMNDVWVSADGGYTWGQCLQDASFQDRRYQMTVLDEADYLYVIGGDQSGRDVNDVWRSSLSFSDLNAVAAACKVKMPVCGPGLNCWPTSPGYQFRSAQNGGVTCTACSSAPPVIVPTGGNEYSSSTALPAASGSEVSGLTTGAVLAIIILVALALVGMYYAWRYWKNLDAGTAAAGGAGGDSKTESLLDTGAATSEMASTTNGTNGTHGETSAETK